MRLVRVPAGAEWRVCCTATRLAQVYIHFLDGRSLPCRRPEAAAPSGASDCAACRAGLSRKFEAYMGAWNATRKIDQVIALPAMAFNEIEGNLGEALAGQMRGHWFVLRRPGESRRGPLHVECLGKLAVAGETPRGLDVPLILRRCWGVSEISLKATDART